MDGTPVFSKFIAPKTLKNIQCRKDSETNPFFFASQDWTDNCDPNPCANGNCTNLFLNYTCNCTEGWCGTNCSAWCDNCSPDPCVHGTCTNAFRGYNCSCDPGWSGFNCSSEIDFCLPVSPCLNGAPCSPVVDSYSCSCLEGTFGFNCSSVNSSFSFFIIDALFQPSNDQLVFTIATVVAAPFSLSSATIGTSALPGTAYQGFLDTESCPTNTQQNCLQTTSFYYSGLAAYSCVLDTTVTFTWLLACRQNNATLCDIPDGTYPQTGSIFLQAADLCGSTNIDLTLSGAGVQLTGAGLSTYSAGDSYALTNSYGQGSTVFASATVSSQVQLAEFFCDWIWLENIGASDREVTLMDGGVPTTNWWPPINLEWVNSPTQFNFSFVPYVGVVPYLDVFLFSDAVGGVIDFTIVANCSVHYYSPAGQRKRSSGDPITYVTLSQEGNFSLTLNQSAIAGNCSNTTCVNGNCLQGPTSFLCNCSSAAWTGPYCNETTVPPTQPPTSPPTSPPGENNNPTASTPQPVQPASDQDAAVVLGVSLGSIAMIAAVALLTGCLCSRPPLARHAYRAVRSFAYGNPEILLAKAEAAAQAHSGDHHTMRRRTARN